MAGRTAAYSSVTQQERLASGSCHRRREHHHFDVFSYVMKWTPQDILHAIDNRPDSTRIPHDAAEGVRPENLARWAASRLSHWLSPAGTPIQSNSQLIATEGRRLRAQARASAERREAELQALAAASVQPISEEKARALAAIRALRKS